MYLSTDVCIVVKSMVSFSFESSTSATVVVRWVDT